MKGTYISCYELSQVSCEKDLQKVGAIMSDIIFPSLKLWEYFVVNVDTTLSEFRAILELKNSDPATFNQKYPLYSELENTYSVFSQDTTKIHEILTTIGIINLPEGGRWSVTIDILIAIALFGSSVRTIDVTSTNIKGNDRTSHSQLS